MDYRKLAHDILSQHWQSISWKRIQHMIRTASTAEKLAEEYSLSAARAYAAGLLHDLAREWPPSFMINRVENRGYSISREEEQYPVLLHGRCAADWIKTKEPRLDADFLGSIIHHTRGRAAMSSLEKIIYIADYVEPGRKYLDQEFRNQWEQKVSLDERLDRVIRDQQQRFSGSRSLI